MAKDSRELKEPQSLDNGRGLIMSLESELDHLMSDCEADGKSILYFIECKIRIREQKIHNGGGFDT